MSYDQIEKGEPVTENKPKRSFSYFHRHTCKHCGQTTEREIPPEQLQNHLIPYHHPPPAEWHAAHTQSYRYTVNVLIAAVVIFLTFFAAKFFYGK
ncbi:hypothetical protein PMAYCL1PPCAC_08826 [Pristionchus mayeri]|uniref:Uncharacterized protein n=1 Tax=Pristionchus mayeri TaxID=1317129 RepID=A0AAN5CEC8_9BILA|nr:hypothetical protein PMAYCL1PPCAC_08826 [Pristionchus mayeri]